MPHRLPLFVLFTAALVASGCRPSAPAAPTAETSTAPTNTSAAVPPPPTTRSAAAPVPPTSQPDARMTPPPADDPFIRFQGYRMPRPTGWRWSAPESAMRAANYSVPGASGEDQIQLVVFRGIRGGVELNVARWSQQFRGPDGMAVEPELTTFDVNGIRVTVVELAGGWRAMGAPAFEPGQRFIGAVIEAPEGEIQMRLAGADSTVLAHRDTFFRILRAMEPVPPA